MNSFFTISFAQPFWFLLLAAIPLYFILLKKRNKAKNFSLGIPEVSRDKLKVSNWKSILYRLLPFLFFAGFTLLTVAMARPQEKFQKQKITSDGIDIVVALDISPSMLAKDFEPDRLTAAKKVILDFIEQRPSDRIGLTVFSGESYTASPPTLDHKVLYQIIGGLEYGTMENGTAIGMGLSTSVNRLKDSKAKSKIVILLTDGSNNSGIVNPKEAGEIAATFGVKVYTIGVGTNGVALTPYRRNYRNELIFKNAKVEIDEELLTDIAEMTGGAYFRATDNMELVQIYDKINQLEKTEFDSTTLVRKEEKYTGFVLSGLILLLIHFTLSFTLYRNIHSA
jgi:Ca-activated chloride channel family protein